MNQPTAEGKSQVQPPTLPVSAWVRPGNDHHLPPPLESGPSGPAFQLNQSIPQSRLSTQHAGRLGSEAGGVLWSTTEREPNIKEGSVPGTMAKIPRKKAPTVCMERKLGLSRLRPEVLREHHSCLPQGPPGDQCGWGRERQGAGGESGR